MLERTDLIRAQSEEAIIRLKPSGKGRLMISYNCADDFEGALQRLNTED